MKIIDKYKSNEGYSECIILYRGNKFIGCAQIHPEDEDMKSERTGAIIAQARAMIQLHKWKKNNEILPALKALKHLYNNISSSQSFNPRSYESIMIRREIQNLEKQVNTIKEMIIEEKQALKEYIELKDKIYKTIRNKKGQT